MRQKEGFGMVEHHSGSHASTGSTNLPLALSLLTRLCNHLPRAMLQVNEASTSAAWSNANGVLDAPAM